MTTHIREQIAGIPVSNRTLSSGAEEVAVGDGQIFINDSKLGATYLVLKLLASDGTLSEESVTLRKGDQQVVHMGLLRSLRITRED